MLYYLFISICPTYVLYKTCHDFLFLFLIKSKNKINPFFLFKEAINLGWVFVYLWVSVVSGPWIIGL